MRRSRWLSAPSPTILPMKAPPRLQFLVEEGLIDTVVRQLMSGKEAMVFVVRCGDETRCAKIYKEATHRSFRQAVDYTENRKVKNSRSARAMAKGSKFGRQEQEAAWQSAEVDALYRLAAAGVRVPQPYNFHDGVLLMELVTDAHGDAAPRLNDVIFTPEQALAHHATLVAEVVRMLCAGVVHGDLSEFNILLAHGNADGSADGDGAENDAAGVDFPVIIDLPQAVDAAGNNHAQRMLLRDVGNLRNFFGQFAPALLTTDYGPEIWSLYQAGLLTNDTPLTGHYERAHADIDMQAVLREIDDARDEEAARRLRMATAV
jgi:RIO kinase 1